MYKNKFEEKAIDFANKLYDEIDLTKDWIIKNIDSTQFSLGEFTKETLDYLVTHHAMKAVRYDSKFDGILSSRHQEDWNIRFREKDKIWLTLSWDFPEEAYPIVIDYGQYYEEPSPQYKEGLVMNKKYSWNHVALIYPRQLEKFLNIQAGKLPKFDLSSGLFEFLGKKKIIKGDLKKRTLMCLLGNINSRVSKKKLWEVRNYNSDQSYETYTKKFSKTKANEPVETGFKELKRELESEYEKVLLLVENDGFGIFIDENALKAQLGKGM